MKSSDQYSKFSVAADNFVDNLVFGKDEDIFTRHQRRQGFYDALGDSAIDLIPGVYAYRAIKYTVNNPLLSARQKAGLCAAHLATECVLDVVRIGALYLTYKVVH